MLARRGAEGVAAAAFGCGAIVMGLSDRWRAEGKGIAFGETRHYVKRVEHLKTLYRRGYRSQLYAP